MRAGLGLREGDPPVALERLVVVDVPVVVQHPAMPVIGVLVQTEVGDHDVFVAELGTERPKGHLRDAVGVPRLGALGVLALGDAEQDEREDAPARDLGGLFPQGLERVLELSGHRRDRYGIRHALFHEQRRDQMAGRELGLAHERAERGGSAHPSRALPGEAGHGADSRARRPG